MKLLFALFFHTISFASDTFTAVTIVGNTIFAGVKTETKGSEVVSSLFTIKEGRKGKISMPKELAGREVVALVPLAKKVLVVTQVTAEQGDNPSVLEFDSATKKWKSIGKLECPTFDKIKLSNSQLVFFCESTSEKGEPLKTKTFLDLGKGQEKETEVSFPQEKSSSKDLQVELVGTPYYWKKIRVLSKNKEALFSLEQTGAKILGN